MDRFSIAIDGTAASGKSTVAKLLAEELGCSYLDTGKLYRALALAFLNRLSQGPEHWEKQTGEISRALEQLTLSMAAPPAGECRIILDGEDVNERLADLEVERATPFAARMPVVRDYLLDVQRDLARQSSVVMAGRDIGTVVLPDATLKVFIEADLTERARRRLSQHQQNFSQADLERAVEDLASRDNKDSQREIAPMVAAADSMRLDSTGLTPEELVAEIKNALLARQTR